MFSTHTIQAATMAGRIDVQVGRFQRVAAQAELFYRRAATNVFCVRHWFQMLKPTTRAIPAEMIQFQSRRNRAFSKHIRENMRQPWTVSVVNFAVAVFVQPASVNMALSDYGRFRSKSCLDIFRAWFVDALNRTITLFRLTRHVGRLAPFANLWLAFISHTRLLTVSWIERGNRLGEPTFSGSHDFSPIPSVILAGVVAW